MTLTPRSSAKVKIAWIYSSTPRKSLYCSFYLSIGITLPVAGFDEATDWTLEEPWIDSREV